MQNRQDLNLHFSSNRGLGLLLLTRFAGQMLQCFKTTCPTFWIEADRETLRKSSAEGHQEPILW